MKRSGFRKQTLAEIKAKQAKKRVSATKRPKKRTTGQITGKKRKSKAPSLRQLKDKLWKEVKRITRERFAPYCYTCGAHVEGQNDHAGHGKPLGALPLLFKYDIRNIRRQCMVCNIHRGGCQDIFIAKLEQEPEGLAFLQEACYLDIEANAWRIRQDIPTIAGRDATIFIENLLKQYKTYGTKQ